MVLDSSDLLDALEPHASDASFRASWRGFLRACAVLLAPRLPAEAAEWIAVADAYERDGLDAAALTAARVRAWQFHDARRAAACDAELSGLRAAMYRLWPDGAGGDWHEAAGHFLDFCAAAGLGQERVSSLLREHLGAWLPVRRGGGSVPAV